MSRTRNSIRNLIFNSGSQFTAVVLGFAVRTVLIKYLGEEYLGINGLFTSIISMLSLAEFGIGSAIVYDLYNPLALKDKHSVLILMNMYKSAYRIIAGIILFLGLCLVPFLQIIIKDDISYININLIFILYLLQSVSSYLFFAYKSSLIRADQKEYIISKINLYFTVVSNVFQMAILISFRNFILYVIIIIVSNILKNIVIAREANKHYPFINYKTNDKVSKEKKISIFKNCYAIFIYKVNGVVLNATDNIIMSNFIGLSIVGTYSNYIMITTAIKNILRMFSNAISASIGNLDAKETKERKKSIFEIINFFSHCMFGTATIVFFVLVNNFITLWIGNEYILSKSIIFLISIDLLLFGMMKTTSVFRTSMGLFRQGKYRPMFGIIINLVVSIYLVQIIGIAGVILGTIIANVLTYVWYDPLIIYKYGFDSSVKSYYSQTAKYILVLLISAASSVFLCSFFKSISILTLILQGFICLFMTGIMFWIFFRNLDEYKYVYNMLKDLLLEGYSKIGLHKV